jgi:hypothetical protein
VAAVRRQQAFMRAMLARRAALGTAAAVRVPPLAMGGNVIFILPRLFCVDHI